MALRRLVEMGIDVAEAETWRDDIDRLLDSAKRIGVQLDEIGALATGPASAIVHLWRREKGLPGEWEHAVVTEVGEVAEAAWMNLLAGPPMAAPAALLCDKEEDEAAHTVQPECTAGSRRDWRTPGSRRRVGSIRLECLTGDGAAPRAG